MKGRVIKGVGGFYFVEGAHDDSEPVMCTARGKLKRKKNMIYVGDVVDYEYLPQEDDYVVTKVHPRKTQIDRPPVSNIDMVVIVFAAAEPEVSYLAVDKMCTACAFKGIDVAICVNKTDLASEDKLREYRNIYSGLYPYAELEADEGSGIEDLYRIIKGRNAALSGPSGVGKSTIINHMVNAYGDDGEYTFDEDTEAPAETGSISEKTKRGRNTTRHVQIFQLDDETSLFDTPGFTSLELPEMDVHDVRECFPEFMKLVDQGRLCRYSDCLHLKEPDCAVKEALNAGELSQSRYDSYCEIAAYEKKLAKTW